jgi:hypothetical protein
VCRKSLRFIAVYTNGKDIRYSARNAQIQGNRLQCDHHHHFLRAFSTGYKACSCRAGGRSEGKEGVSQYSCSFLQVLLLLLLLLLLLRNSLQFCPLFLQLARRPIIRNARAPSRRPCSHAVFSALMRQPARPSGPTARSLGRPGCASWSGPGWCPRKWRFVGWASAGMVERYLGSLPMAYGLGGWVYSALDRSLHIAWACHGSAAGALPARVTCCDCWNPPAGPGLGLRLQALRVRVILVIPSQFIHKSPPSQLLPSQALSLPSQAFRLGDRLVAGWQSATQLTSLMASGTASIPHHASLPLCTPRLTRFAGALLATTARVARWPKGARRRADRR